METVAAAGVTSFAVHARIAVLDGLSPAENREIPPLRYDAVYRLKQELPELEVVINGGVASLDEAAAHLGTVDGAMIGRRGLRRPRHAARCRPPPARRSRACPAKPARHRPRHAALRAPGVRGRRAAPPDHPAHAGPLRGPGGRGAPGAARSAVASIAPAPGAEVIEEALALVPEAAPLGEACNRGAAQPMTLARVPG